MSVKVSRNRGYKWYDILATTSNEVMVDSTYADDVPVVGKVEKPKKWLFEPKDLQVADKFTFGSIIGQITNNVTTIRCLMSDYSEDSREYQTLINRMRMGCKLQSLQIDKAKIGRAVKGIPTVWNKWNKINEEDTEEQIAEKKFLNSLLCDKHPYFFIYLYDATRKKYKKWNDNFDSTCRSKWGISIEELLNLNIKTDEQNEFIARYYKNCPVIDNNCAMNLLAHHMEKIKNDIKINIRQCADMSYINLYKRKFDDDYEGIDYNKVRNVIKELKNELKKHIQNHNKNEFNENVNNDISCIYKLYADKLYSICSNKYQLINCLIDLFYIDYPSYNKDVLWNMFGDDIVENVKYNSGNTVYLPIEDMDGEVFYLGKKYKITKINME